MPWSRPVVCHGCLGSLQAWVLLVCRVAQSPEFGHLKPLQQWHRKVNSPPLPKTFLFLVVQFEPHVSFFITLWYLLRVNVEIWFCHLLIPYVSKCTKIVTASEGPLKGHQSAFFPGLTVYLLKLQWGVHLRTGDSFSQSTLLRARMSFAAKPGKKGLLLPNNVKPQKQGLEQP